MKQLYTLLALFMVFSASAQVSPAPKASAKTSCDCGTAIPLQIGITAAYGMTQAPVGFGQIQEIRSSVRGDKQSFALEHNSAWYLLNIKYSGELVFEITPQDTTNDYDFILYKYTDTNFCSLLINKLPRPVRSNISRNRPGTQGMTGLSEKAKNEFAAPGPGSHLSSSIKVKNGEQYMLVLDNVYPEGKGHRISFNFLKTVEITGKVTDEKSNAIIADVALSDNKGNVVGQTTSNSEGLYSLKAPVKENVNYTLSFMNDSSFVSTSIINTKTLKNTFTFKDIHTVLPKLKKGGKYKLGNINFYGDQAVLLPASFASVHALYKLMKKNKKMRIQVEGHVNHPGKDRVDHIQKLSEDRAATVRKYLTDKGIEKIRIEIIGLSNKKMLFPLPKDENEASANRRVEINVVEIE